MFDIIVYMKLEVECIVWMGGYLVRIRGELWVILLDKVNVLVISRFWCFVVEEVFKNEFFDLKVEY